MAAFSAVARPDAAFVRRVLPAIGGKVAFEPFGEVVWEQKARRALAWLNPDHPTPAQIAILKKKLPDPSAHEGYDPETARVEFLGALDPAMTRGHFYFVTPKGIYTLKLEDLAGTAEFKFDKSHREIVSKRFIGEVVARVVNRVPDDEEGGFVLFSPTSTPPSRKTPAPSALLRRLPEKDKPEDIRFAFTFQFGGAPFLFVKWKGYTEDERTYCAYEYTLYSAGSEVTEIEAAAFGCDV